jgi:hypothetical protein
MSIDLGHLSFRANIMIMIVNRVYGYRSSEEVNELRVGMYKMPSVKFLQNWTGTGGT